MQSKKLNVGRALAALVLCATMILTACSTAWITEAEEIVTALIPAASNLLTLIEALDGKGVSTQDLQVTQSASPQAQTDFQLINTLITQYQQATDAATQASLLRQIQTAIATVQTNLSALLPALHITDAATQAKVTAVIGLILAEVQSLEAIIPIVQPIVTSSTSLARASAKAKTTKVKPPLSASQFRTSYNAIMTAKTGNATLDAAAAKCKLHGPGFWSSLGKAIGEARFGQ
ncbi:MAG: hypothetical protein WAO10_00205 [Candidatus Sulfotelmatobacter sp.]